MAAVPSPFTWDESFSVKNSTIDEQHKGLFTGIDKLDKSRSDKQCLESLVGLVKEHFNTEEALFMSKGFPDADDHKKTHDKFIDDVAGVKDVGDEQITFLKEWLVNHIKGSDFKYIEHLKE
eukprot:GHVN01071453.1.p1 GENE.GHVN01071453.1~~GHVN01071453.1.p1  ORF type:complete len:121 (+),score=23.17 GHVN01071453.1:175-537(+)